MIILELFAGTRAISKAFINKGHQAISIDWDSSLEGMTLYADISKLSASDIIKICGRKPDVIWASPDCTTYSIAGISHHRQYIDGVLTPKSDYAKFCDETNRHVINLIKELEPKYYFIENPRGCFRKMDFIKGIPRYTVTYCKYGDSRMKPTDIFTNYPDPEFIAPCKNGDSCHERAPRGSKTGTQGLKGAKNRGVIPKKLCEHIVEICEKGFNKNE